MRQERVDGGAAAVVLLALVDDGRQAELAPRRRVRAATSAAMLRVRRCQHKQQSMTVRSTHRRVQGMLFLSAAEVTHQHTQHCENNAL